MKNARSTLLKLIRIALWGPDTEALCSIPDWDKVLFLANRQTVLGLVADAVSCLPKEYQPESELCLKLRKYALRIIQSHTLLNRKVADLKVRLDGYGVHSVLFKGQGLALNYPNPTSRQCGDIDMWVGERNFARVHGLLKPDSNEDLSKFRHSKHFNLEEDGVEMEIHRIAEILPGYRRDRLFREWTTGHLEGPHICRVDIGGVQVNLPPIQFNVLYIMNHIWHHFMWGGIGLRQICDWTMFLHRYCNDIDCEVLRKDLERFGLMRGWQILGGLAVNYLGLPADECPLYTGEYDKKSDRMLEVIWSEGNFGHHPDVGKKPRPEGHFAGKFHSFRNTTARIIRIFAISPVEVAVSWWAYLITGLQNVFVRIK